MNEHNKINLLNQQALYLLQKGKPKESLNKLHQAEDMYRQQGTPNPKLAATIKNNFACYYRAVGQPKQALPYLREALEIETDSQDQDIVSISCTHLNLSAVLSDLGRFQLSYKYALNAQAFLNQQQQILQGRQKKPNEQEQSEVLRNQQAICCLTISSVLQSLRDYKGAVTTLKQALQAERLHPDPNLELIEILTKDIQRIEGTETFRKQQSSSIPASSRIRATSELSQYQTDRPRTIRSRLSNMNQTSRSPRTIERDETPPHQMKPFRITKPIMPPIKEVLLKSPYARPVKEYKVKLPKHLNPIRIVQYSLDTESNHTNQTIQQ